ncbi:MAG: DUF4913 domain-containing protein [Kineosporiaceae bacterium]
MADDLFTTLDPYPGAFDGVAEPATLFTDVEEFVAEYLTQVYRRHVEGRTRTWCPQWWRHAEAVIRLEGLWRAWEQLRTDPAFGMSTWYRDHADPHMAVLLDPDGPFRRCSPDRGHSPDTTGPLPMEASADVPQAAVGDAHSAVPAMPDASR